MRSESLRSVKFRCSACMMHQVRRSNLGRETKIPSWEEEKLYRDFAGGSEAWSRNGREPVPGNFGGAENQEKITGGRFSVIEGKIRLQNLSDSI